MREAVGRGVPAEPGGTRLVHPRRGKMPHPRKRKPHLPEVRLPAAPGGRESGWEAGGNPDSNVWKSPRNMLPMLGKTAKPGSKVWKTRAKSAEGAKECGREESLKTVKTASRTLKSGRKAGENAAHRDGSPHRRGAGEMGGRTPRKERPPEGTLEKAFLFDVTQTRRGQICLN